MKEVFLCLILYVLRSVLQKNSRDCMLIMLSIRACPRFSGR